MIEVTQHTAFIIYLLMVTTIFAIFTAIEIWRHYTHNWKIGEDRLARCNSCNYVFILKRHQKVARCPRCEKICQIRRK